MRHLNGREVDVWSGETLYCCTIEAGRGGELPFRAQCNHSGFFQDFSADTAKELNEKGSASNMKLV